MRPSLQIFFYHFALIFVFPLRLFYFSFLFALRPLWAYCYEVQGRRGWFAYCQRGGGGLIPWNLSKPKNKFGKEPCHFLLSVAVFKNISPLSSTQYQSSTAFGIGIRPRFVRNYIWKIVKNKISIMFGKSDAKKSVNAWHICCEK